MTSPTPNCSDVEAIGIEPVGRGSRQQSQLRAITTRLGSTAAHQKHKVQTALDHEAVCLVLDGRERTSGESLSACYFGAKNNLEYLLDRVFQSYRVRSSHPSLHAWQARKVWNSHSDDVDLLVGDLPWPYQRLLAGSGVIVTPAWVQQYIPLAQDWPGVVAKFHKGAKSDLRQIKRLGLECRVSQRRQDKDAFYDDFYLPFMNRRHGALAHVEPKSRVTHLCKTGVLMQILHDGRVVAAGLMRATGMRLGLLWCGMPGGVDESQTEGAFAALYYFATVYAYEQGYSEVNLNYSRALLNDGVYRYKRKWGGELRSGYNLGYLLFKPTRTTRAVAAFLAANPSIAQEGQRLVARVLTDTPLDSERALRLAKANWIDGLDRLKIYASRGVEDNATKAVLGRYARTELVDLANIRETAARVCA